MNSGRGCPYPGSCTDASGSGHGVTQLGWTPFPKRFWQRNYRENIIRDEQSWDTIRGYILNNPLAWESKPLHLEKYHPQPDL